MYINRVFVSPVKVCCEVLTPSLMFQELHCWEGFRSAEWVCTQLGRFQSSLACSSICRNRRKRVSCETGRGCSLDTKSQLLNSEVPASGNTRNNCSLFITVCLHLRCIHTYTNRYTHIHSHAHFIFVNLIPIYSQLIKMKSVLLIFPYFLALNNFTFNLFLLILITFI